ncbi:hypothetical protein UFOVP1413_4 [uncultured Caudovirales phage]|uniref:Uncharacterized protein n=2 Tax=uncultured Caudovirales phage TaxID=2100421 RepID=A0A6J5S979_9CAUD|nr:hypothetical protein UFOVP1413_4 [uncultured Caudovirales phage]
MNGVEHHARIYWSLRRQFCAGQWNMLATVAITGLLQSPYERVRLMACELWYGVTTPAIDCDIR